MDSFDICMENSIEGYIEYKITPKQKSKWRVKVIMLYDTTGKNALLIY